MVLKETGKRLEESSYEREHAKRMKAGYTFFFECTCSFYIVFSKKTVGASFDLIHDRFDQKTHDTWTCKFVECIYIYQKSLNP